MGAIYLHRVGSYPADLTSISAKELYLALIIARRKSRQGDKREAARLKQILSEYNRRGIKP